MKVHVKESISHGKGVFASDRISAGERILVFTGPILARAEVREDDYHLQIGPNTYLGPSGEIDDYVNHSCEPNAAFSGGPYLVALRQIEPGEEITCDYSTAIDEDDFGGFPCQCGAKGCRGIVHSFRHLDPNTQERLKPYVLPYLAAQYFAERNRET
jgi:SET domain-containing protein